MPIYEYRCQDCNKTFEEIVSSSQSDQAPECPECSSAKTEKLMSASASVTAGSSNPQPSCAPSGGG